MPGPGELGVGFGVGTRCVETTASFSMELADDVPAGGTVVVLVAWAATGGPKTLTSVAAGALAFTAAQTITGYDPGLNADYGLAAYRAYTAEGMEEGDEIAFAFSATVAAVMVAAVANVGVTPVSPVDGVPAGIFRAYGSAAQAWTSGPVSTAHAKDWLVGGAFSLNSPNAYTNEPSGPVNVELYDFLFDPGSGPHMAVQNVNVAARNSYATSGIWSAVDFSDLTIMVALKAGIGSPPPVNTALPQITGQTDRDGGNDNCEAGDVLTCSTGTWTGGNPMTFAYQWVAGGTQIPIPGETASTYTVDLEQTALGRQLTCRVTATNLDDEATATATQLLTVLDPDAPDVLVWVGNRWQAAQTLVRLDGDWQ